MESLGKIFGSPQRVRIMRLFLFNNKTAFDIEDVVLRSRTKRPDARKELTMLTNIGFLRRKSFSKKVLDKRTTKSEKQKFNKVKRDGWIVNPKFEMIEPLQTLLLDSELVKEKDLAKRIKKSGSVRLLALSGVFVKNDDRKLDILVIGDKLKKDILEKEILQLESEIGRELRYAIFDVKEYNYRIQMYDKLIRDVMEHEHIKLVNTLTK